MKFSTFLVIMILIVACNEESNHELQISNLKRANDSLRTVCDSFHSECNSKDIDLGRYDFIISNLSPKSKREVDSISQNAE
jgi:hypothetical protein